MQENWWSRAVVYQIYPQSFMDTNGDGVGDLPGITQKLDYLQQLGVDTLWICPMYPSPMVDGGYDIQDYQGVHPLFGNMQQMEELLEKAEEKGMRVLLDLVLNHTSDQHPWFLQAKNHPDSPYRDYYIFKKGKEGNPPNNWRSNFGGGCLGTGGGWGVLPACIFHRAAGFELGEPGFAPGAVPDDTLVD